jgi:hypothetical protein
MLQLPDNYDTMTDEEEQREIMEVVESSNILHTYQKLSQATIPILKAVEEVPRDDTRGLYAIALASEHFFSQTANLKACNICGNGAKEREGCCIEGATASDYIHKRAE